MGSALCKIAWTLYSRIHTISPPVEALPFHCLSEIENWNWKWNWTCIHSLNSTTIVVEVSLPGLTRPDENLVPRSTRLPRSLFLHPCSYSYQARFKVRKGRYLTICLTKYLTILDEAYVSKIAVLRETNLQDCNPAQSMC